jgi:DNA-binding NarL/FixJ family response regulator
MNRTEELSDPNMLRVLVVDDTDSMRVLVTQYLQRIDHVAVAGDAADADDALKKVKECKPDIVLMDISLSGVSGVTVTRTIKSLFPDMRVYLFSAYEVDEFRDVVPDSPADGFIQKSKLKIELTEMIRKELERKRSQGRTS